MKKKGLNEVRIVILLFSLLITTLEAEIKSLWLTAWDVNTPEKIDEAVEFALSNDFSQLLVHVRYRGDALYQPNRLYDIYQNPEPVSYTFYGNVFDPLTYIIKQTENTNLEIHAWVTVFVVTPRVTENIAPNHIYHRKPEWITADIFGEKMNPADYEGAYLDPGIPEVQDYLLNVFKDIVLNYNIDGLHLDYIRYPDSQFGYSKIALENYYDTPLQTDFSSWKEEQVTRFVRRCYAEIKYLCPEIILSAAVVSNLDRAAERYSQNWISWLEEGIIDYAYTMTYGLTDEAVSNDLNLFEDRKDRIIIGLRAWSEANRPWTATDLNSKINIVRKREFSGLAMFSYSGLKDIMDGTLSRSFSSAASSAIIPNNNYIFGYLSGNKGERLSGINVILDNGETAVTDANGFYLFSGLPVNNYYFKAEKGISVFLSDSINLRQNNKVNGIRYNIPHTVFR